MRAFGEVTVVVVAAVVVGRGVVDEAQVHGVVMIVRITVMVELAAVAPSGKGHGVAAMAAGMQAHGVAEVRPRSWAE